MGGNVYNNSSNDNTSNSGVVDNTIYKYRLKGILAGILLIMSIAFLHYGGRGEVIEYIMIGITAFLVGGAIYGKK
jgi:hypothetical protein